MSFLFRNILPLFGSRKDAECEAATDKTQDTLSKKDKKKAE